MILSHGQAIIIPYLIVIQPIFLNINFPGDKLSHLEERTQRMMNEAENFSGTAHQLMLKAKEKDKKWYYF